MGLKKVKLQMMNTCLTLQSCNCTGTNPIFQKSVKENCPGKESTNSEEDARLEILSGVLVLKTNQWLLVREAFATWINMKFVKVISKGYFHSFSNYFYPRMY